MASATTLDDLRRYAVARTLFAPTTLGRAIDRLGFVQADPIRAPARAQDLTLRHRVKGYRAGDLERRYARLDIEEDFFVNYGFLPRPLGLDASALRHHAVGRGDESARGPVLDFVRERAACHPREVDAHFAHGSVTNYWGGSSNATTHLLDAMHYRGLLRALRDSGIRLYAAAHELRRQPMPRPVGARSSDALVDVVVRKYAPLPAASLDQVDRAGCAPRRSGMANCATRCKCKTTAGALRVDRWRRLVLARGRRSARRVARTHRRGAPARAVRPGGLGPAPLRAVLGLGLPLRGLHAGAETQARLLRAAAVVARPGHRLGQCRDHKRLRALDQQLRLHRRPRAGAATRGRSCATRWNRCASFSATEGS